MGIKLTSACAYNLCHGSNNNAHGTICLFYLGAFFQQFPRHRKLISINKRHTGEYDRAIEGKGEVTKGEMGGATEGKGEATKGKWEEPQRGRGRSHEGQGKEPQRGKGKGHS